MVTVMVTNGVCVCASECACVCVCVCSVVMVVVVVVVMVVVVVVVACVRVCVCVSHVRVRGDGARHFARVHHPRDRVIPLLTRVAIVDYIAISPLNHSAQTQ
jgi:hypothetical protein